jgi:hypothetical protein
VVDDTRPPLPDDYRARLDDLVASDRRGQAVRLFMSKGVRVPAIFVAMMRFMPAWMRNGVRALAGVLPNASHRTLEGQTRIVKPAALTPVLVEFFKG